ncbi:MAG TPA: NAD(P)/FAD-dependent oxidoreductase [Ramlibacter sp.]|uniref:NAD(P)/FAD-dependent oxidoreductase n=1 Tax=Ramlibacter sp. TaxID=1917967 RepID=UPI002BF20701|nr:NAD(P)/FAD-dependent oxidoreductase [Ramlibacter sp.]HVZ43633.1 NAD(P)/FAD-dependent oxidoreductase [Ramlibacter sp.]
MKPYDSLIIGGGPAGASCAIWLQQLGFRPCIVERRARLGGLQNDSPYVNNWIAGVAGRTGVQFAADIAAHVESLGIDFALETEATRIRRSGDSFEVQRAGGEPFAARTVVLATGVKAVDGGLTPGANVIVGPGRAVVEADFRGKRVAILGGGDNAFENHAFILGQGAREVRIFARSIRARAALRDAVAAGSVTVGPYRVEGRAVAVNGEPFDCLVVLYGWAPVIPPVEGDALELDAQGFVKVDANQATSQPGIYAAGEITRRSHPCCTTAMAEGVAAAKAIQARLEQTVSPRSS